MCFRSQSLGLTLGLAVLASAGCSPAPPPDPPPVPTATAETAPTTASTAAPKAPKHAGPVPCGELECMLYDTPEQALEAVLAQSKPLVLALGEAHAPSGAEGVASSTKRFTNDLLPLFEGKASDLVIELLIADDKCKKATAKVEKNVEKPVTKNQAKSNKHEFVTLGNVSKELRIRPHVLRPSCDDYQQVASAGADGVMKMLSLIAALTDDLVQRILKRNEREGQPDQMVLAYGGAMHNDVTPRPGREAWSYAKALRAASADRYVELDIFVPEYIRDSDTWKAFAWYPHYDAATHGAKVALFRTGERSFVLIFPTGGR